MTQAQLADCKDLPCEKCGSLYFLPVVRFKYVSAIMSETGTAFAQPIQAFACSNCGDVRDPFQVDDNKEESDDKKSNIISPS